MPKRSFGPRDSGFREPKTFIVVATEGRVTEEHYLSAFKPPRDAVFQLTVLPTGTTRAIPRSA